MESSIAVFLKRQIAFEQLPTGQEYSFEQRAAVSIRFSVLGIPRRKPRIALRTDMERETHPCLFHAAALGVSLQR